MLMYSPWEIMGKKLNTIMWVQSSWTGTLVRHFAMSPLVTANPSEENSLPKKGTHLKVRQEMCFYAAGFLAAIKLTATKQKGNFWDFQKYAWRMLTNIWAVIEKQVQAQATKPISYLRSLRFWLTVLGIFMWRPHKYLWGQGVVAQHFPN